MRLVFLGSPAFAVPTLERLVESGARVLEVVTQPDRPRGRGQQAAAPPVKEAALRLGLPVYQPERVRRPEAVDRLRTLAPDAMVVVGYGQIIPQAIIDIPRLGIINVHASLLPKYRGAAPVQWAIANGETRTGVTTMRIDAGLDTGDMLLTAETGIGPAETAVELGARLAAMGADLLVRTLEGLEAGSLDRPETGPGRGHLRAPVEEGRWPDRLEPSRPKPFTTACAASNPGPERTPRSAAGRCASGNRGPPRLRAWRAGARGSLASLTPAGGELRLGRSGVT